MKVHRRQIGLVLGFVLGACVLSGVAAAGNPHGTPPGQAGAQTGSTSSASVKSSPGQAKKQASSASSAGVKSGSKKANTQTSSSTGVKPSSTTQHHTNAPAGSNRTKLYGKGKTAGQIAMNGGASADTNLYGPGNSQPHKVSVCSKNGKSHYVDVHVLKAHHGASCAAGSNAASSGSASSAGVQAGVVGTTTNGGASAGAWIHFRAAGGFTPPRATRHSGVLGAGHAVTAQAKPAHPVVGSANFTG